eukprot:s3409_g2.t1
MPGPAVAPHLKGADLDAHGQAVLDEVLSPEALKALSRQLQESSMYFHREETGTYLDGLASPLLWQIAMELMEALPALADHFLCETKAYKALSGGSTSPGLAAQGADVALLLWALPTDSGVLVLYVQGSLADALSGTIAAQRRQFSAHPLCLQPRGALARRLRRDGTAVDRR